MNAVQLFRDALAAWDITPSLRGPGEDVDLPDPSSDPDAPATVAFWRIDYPGIESSIGPTSEAQVTFGGTREIRGELVIGIWVQSGERSADKLEGLKADAAAFLRACSISGLQLLAAWPTYGAPDRLAGWYGSNDFIRLPWVAFEEEAA